MRALGDGPGSGCVNPMSPELAKLSYPKIKRLLDGSLGQAPGAGARGRPWERVRS